MGAYKTSLSSNYVISTVGRKKYLQVLLKSLETVEFLDIVNSKLTILSYTRLCIWAPQLVLCSCSLNVGDSTSLKYKNRKNIRGELFEILVSLKKHISMNKFGY